MANWSDYSVELKFNHIFDLKGFNDSIKQHTSNGYFSIQDGSASIEDLTIDMDQLSIFFYGEGRWSAPIEYFEKVARNFNATGVIYDLEPGSDFFVYIKLENGESIDFIDDVYFCKESYELLGYDYFAGTIEYMFKHEEEIEELISIIGKEEYEELKGEYDENMQSM